MRTETLYCTEGTSDKQYTVTLSQVDGGFTILCFNGRRGGPQSMQTKTPQPVPLEEAEKLYAKIRREKLAKGYQPGGDAAPMNQPTPEASPELATADRTSPNLTTGASGRAHRDFKPMLLNSISDPEPYLRNQEWVMQQKADGVRAIVLVHDGVPLAFSRTGLPVAISVSASTILANWFDGCIIDAEVIGEGVMVFDLLSHHGTDLRGYPCSERLRALASKFPVGSRRTGVVKMIHTAYTEKDKREMLEALHADGAEGAVFKQASAPYRAGRPNSGGPALKLKFIASASVTVVSHHQNGKRSVNMALIDGTEVGAVTIPPNHQIPPIGRVIEVEYLYAHRGGSLVQAVYKGIRSDVDPDGAESLQYKGEER